MSPILGGNTVSAVRNHGVEGRGLDELGYQLPDRQTSLVFTLPCPAYE